MIEKDDLRNAVATLDEISGSLDACMDELKAIRKVIEAADRLLHPEYYKEKNGDEE